MGDDQELLGLYRQRTLNGNLTLHPEPSFPLSFLLSWGEDGLDLTGMGRWKRLRKFRVTLTRVSRTQP